MDLSLQDIGLIREAWMFSNIYELGLVRLEWKCFWTCDIDDEGLDRLENGIVIHVWKFHYYWLEKEFFLADENILNVFNIWFVRHFWKCIKMSFT